MGLFAYLCLATVCATAALPEPPKQHSPWERPTSTVLPDFVISTAAKLFDAGLADPRTGEYREVVLVLPGYDHDVLRTHAWLISGHYAACWDGLVYPVKSIGARVNLERDVREIAASQPSLAFLPMLMEQESKRERLAFWDDLQRARTLLPSSIAILLRIGRADLAEILWRASESARSWKDAATREASEHGWFATAVEAWFAQAYLRLVDAFERGKNQEAADIAESLLEWRSRASATWRESNKGATRTIPAISFLEPVPALLTDSQRRWREPQRSEIDLAAVSKGADKSGFLQQAPAARIAYLIIQLQDVRAAKLGFPGPLLFALDPVYRLLKKEGDAAVEALLDAFENDERLTRTFDYSRPWSIQHDPIPTRRVVELLLIDILGDRERIKNSTPAELRCWWRQHRSKDKVMRSWALLADDQASPTNWLESANFLTTRSDIERSEGQISYPEEACDPSKYTPAPLAGEPLRARRNPSLSDLLAKRTAALVASSSELACQMAVRATFWDPANALPVLQNASVLKSCRSDALVTVARLSAGDSDAATVWSRELRERADISRLNVEELMPLWMFPNDLVLQQTAEWLFAKPESPLAPRLRHGYAGSVLLTIPAYRRAVLSALDDVTTLGSATRSQSGAMSYQLTDGEGGGGNPREESGRDPRQAPAGENRPVRVKDLIAWRLLSIEGAPEFELDWPTLDKDEAIRQIATFLKVQEPYVRAFPARLEEAHCPLAQLYLKQ